MLKLFTLGLLALIASTHGQVISLEKYNIDPTSVTVSGLSSGGAFATQYHTIFSSELKGAAIFAGIVYHCANGIMGTALTCMSSPYLNNVKNLIKKTEDLSAKGDIDNVANIAGTKVYIFAGTKDTVVRPGNGQDILEFYTAFNALTLTSFDIVAQHCMPTDFYGQDCAKLNDEYINFCEYNGAYESLNFLYDETLARPNSSETPPGIFSQFDQQEFFTNLKDASMDTVGFIYIPTGCVDKTATCKLHAVFHGCKQGREYLDDVYATKAGYLQVAEANNIITIFPQAVKQALNNPNGCWDWWGYTGMLAYATHDGVQNVGIRAMLNRLING